MKLKFIPVFFAALMPAFFVSAAENAPVDFALQIKPIFEERCVECHNSETLLGELNLQNRELAMKKRNAGPVIIPGKPDLSQLLLGRVKVNE